VNNSKEVTKLTNYREIIRLASLGLSKTGIGKQLGCSRNTISVILGRAQRQNIRWPLPDNQNDKILEETLFPEKAAESHYKMPDYAKVHHDMGKPGVTFTLLWDEYCSQCRQNGEIPYAYTQFRYHYYEYVQTTKATMHITHKPGNKVEVDWAGTTCQIIDSDTGEVIPAYVFVGVLPCSGYCYVEAFLTMNQESWINAHIHMFQFFGGVAKIITSDNLKVGVVKSDWYSPEINRSYHDCAEYYGCVVIPARVRHPKDKPTAEGGVGIITTWIIAALRNQKFFTLFELNEAIQEKLQAFNEKPFQKKPGSRFSAYMEEEKEFMLPLPLVPYEMAVWKKLIPGFNYHIEFEKNFYSVPYDYIKQEMDVRVTKNILEVYYNNLRICSHSRLYGKPGQYHTLTEHMPEKHQKYIEWNSERFLSWASSIGDGTEIAIRAILSSHKIEQQGYRACIGVLKLADKYGNKRLENACHKALSYTPSPSFKSIDSILKTGQDKFQAAEDEPKRENNSHAYIRGAEYYGRKK